MPFIEKKLFLKVNREKTVLDEARRAKIKEHTSRSNGVGNEDRAKKLRRYIMGIRKLKERLLANIQQPNRLHLSRQ